MDKLQAGAISKEALSGDAQSFDEDVKKRKILSPTAQLKNRAKLAKLKLQKQARLQALQAEAQNAARANMEAIRSVNARAKRAAQKPVSDNPAAQSAKRSTDSSRVQAGNAANAHAQRSATQRVISTKVARKKADAIRKAGQKQTVSGPHTRATANGAAVNPSNSTHQAASKQRAMVKVDEPANERLNQNSKSPPASALNNATNGPPIISATALLAAKYPSYFAESNNNRTKSESRVVLLVVSFIVGLIAFGWANWSSINFEAIPDLSYNLGLVGGIIMLVILTYALRKRLKVMRKAGNMEAWYYFHLFGGVFGPLLIVFHTSFTVKSVNSAVALVTMCLIVLSGLFGRYIYTRIGYNLHQRLLAIKESEKEMIDSLRGYRSPISDVIERHLSNFALACLTGSRSLFRLPIRMLAIRTASAACYVKVVEDMTTMVNTRAKHEAWPGDVYKSELANGKAALRHHINAVAEIAHSHLFERLLVKWRILHVPLLYILVITGAAHVLAVHMY